MPSEDVTLDRETLARSHATSAHLPEARMTEIVFPDHTNHLGTLFGGQALAWMDEAAFIVVSRHARCTVVTARSEKIDFTASAPTGALVDLIARIVAVGRSSMQVDVELHCEQLHNGQSRLATRGRFTIVALDEKGSRRRCLRCRADFRRRYPARTRRVRAGRDAGPPTARAARRLPPPCCARPA